jgi:hypothetical protein
MVQMTSKQPLIIIIWMHQEMMAWMSRKSIGFLDGIVEDFGSEVGRSRLTQFSFTLHKSATNPTQHDLYGTSTQPLIIIMWMHQEMMAWVSRKSIGFLDGIVE